MSRKDAREAAMKLLYQIEMTGEHNNDSIEHIKEGLHLDKRDILYIRTVVDGFLKERNSIDGFIARYSKGWSINRISKVDLSILRLALYEIIYCKDIPVGVSINECVELAKRFSSEKSGIFINGLLGNFIRTELSKAGELIEK